MEMGVEEGGQHVPNVSYGMTTIMPVMHSIHSSGPRQRRPIGVIGGGHSQWVNTKPCEWSSTYFQLQRSHCQMLCEICLRTNTSSNARRCIVTTIASSVPIGDNVDLISQPQPSSKSTPFFSLPHASFPRTRPPAASSLLMALLAQTAPHCHRSAAAFRIVVPQALNLVQGTNNR